MSNKIFVFDLKPVGKPRMTRSDKWRNDPNHPDPDKRQRKRVTDYYIFKDAITLQARKQHFELSNGLHYYFFLQIRNSWTKSKKTQMLGLLCQEKPDLDNLIKAVWDSLAEEDKSIAWIGESKKFWALEPKIVISEDALRLQELRAYAHEPQSW